MRDTTSGSSCLGWMKPRRQAWLNDPTHSCGTRVHIVGFLLGFLLNGTIFILACYEYISFQAIEI
jgi:hypothetical protein